MRAWLIGIMLCVSGLAKAQLLDTSSAHQYKPLEVYKVSERGLIHFKEDSLRLDTSLFLFYQSYSINQRSFPFVDLGYEGSPNLQLKQAELAPLKVDLGFKAVDYYHFNNELQRYYVDRPFTRLNYSQGGNELIFIEASHAQQISERLTFGIDYRRLKNQNFYYSNLSSGDRKRFTNLFNAKFYTGYYSPKRKYEVLAGFVWNKSENIETGGLLSDSVFESLSARNKLSNNPVYLSDALNSYATHSYKINQYFRLRGAAADSLHPSDLNRFASQLVLKTMYSGKRLEYTDTKPDSAFYGIKLSNIHDSIHHSHFSNELGLTNRFGEKTMYIALQQQLDRVYQDSGHKTAMDGLIAKLEFRIPVKHWESGLKAKYGVVGYNQNNYQIGVNASTRINTIKVHVGLESRKVQPFFLQSTFFSQALSYTNTLKDVQSNSANLTLKWRDKQQELKFGLSIYAYRNLLFADSSLIPQQYEKAVGHFMAALRYKAHWNFLYFNLEGMYQNVNQEQEVLQRPEFSASSAIYGQFRLFKTNLLTQLGVQSQWMSSFNLGSYNSYTRQWLVGGNTFEYYSPIQLFLNAKVKSFNFGLNVYHLQQGLMGEAYYASPSYPIMPRAVRLNVRWDMAD